jgi:hypothetical protein
VNSRFYVAQRVAQTGVGYIILVNGVSLDVGRPGSGKETDDFVDIPNWILHGRKKRRGGKEEKERAGRRKRSGG